MRANALRKDLFYKACNNMHLILNLNLFRNIMNLKMKVSNIRQDSTQFKDLVILSQK